MRLPADFSEVSGVGARGFARPEAVRWVEGALARWGSLERAALHASDALEMRGRGVVRAVPTPHGGRWVVRRYRRGGSVASLLGDRYARLGASRPLREAAASGEARARGIPTPRVMAGVVYPAGAFYRADLVSEYVSGSADLARVLFHAVTPGAPGPPDPEFRVACMEAAGSLIMRLAAAGLRHRDLNAMNLLVEGSGDGQPHLHVLDLDRARIERPGRVDPAWMAARLERSLRKLERRTDRPVREREWQALARGLHPGREGP